MTYSYTWEITENDGNTDIGAFTTTDGTEAANAQLVGFSETTSQAGTYTVKFLNTITIAENGNSSEPSVFFQTDSATDADKIVFEVTVTNPCPSATINAPAITAMTTQVNESLY